MPPTRAFENEPCLPHAIHAGKETVPYIVVPIHGEQLIKTDVDGAKH
jgi:hypothetical protein